MIVARSSLAAAALQALVVVAANGPALAGGAAVAKDPFESFSGAWTGGGELIGANGDRERIRCRANYVQSAGGDAMTQTIVCASASYRMDIESYIEASGGIVRGTWSETTRNVSGYLSGRVADGRFQGAVRGPNFTAQISLRSNGKRQEVSIQPSGGDIAAVRIDLQRRG